MITLAPHVHPRRKLIARKFSSHPRFLLLFIAPVVFCKLVLNRQGPKLTEESLALPEESPPHHCPSTRHAPLYVFLHLHKTAGNSLKQALHGFAARNDLTIFHTCHRSKPGFKFLSWLLNRQTDPSSFDCNLDEVWGVSRFNRSKIDLIVGHQYFGVHALFHPRPARYFTFIRHPVFRKTSHFLHFESQNASLTEYLITKNRNYMTKRLATHEPSSDVTLYFRSRMVDVDPFALNAALSAAKSHLLRNFFFVGLYHRRTESVCVLSIILNRACRSGSLNNGYYPRLTNSRPLKPEQILRETANVRGHTDRVVQALPKDVLRKVAQAEAADMMLYEMAEKLFEAKLAHYPECREIATPPPPSWQYVTAALSQSS